MTTLLHRGTGASHAEHEQAAPPLRRIFHHDIMGCTADGVSGNHLYSGRALGATEPGDLILLHPELASQWDAIRAHYARIGLRHTDDVIWDVDHHRLAQYPEYDLSAFFFGAAEQQVRPHPHWYWAVQHINSKNGFAAVADALGVPIPTTLCFDQARDIGAKELIAAPYPCYLKAAVSVSGVGIYRCADAAALGEAMTRFAPDTPVQIQAEVPSRSFLNLQYEAAPDGLHALAATEQVLDGFAHQGNRHPAEHAPWDLVDPMAQWLVGEGMRGVFAFDVAVIETPDGPAFKAIECNPRWNGASYPTAVARKLGIEHWLARAFPTQHRRLADIDLTGIEFDPERGRGVILINWGPVLIGKLLALLAGGPETQQALATELAERL
jgi:hypothetical protein